MAKAFEAPGDPVPTWKTIGEVIQVAADGFVGQVEDEYGDPFLIQIPLANIVESERPRIVRFIMFFCDLEIVPEGEVGSIRGIEFSDELTDREFDRTIGILGGVMKRAEERILPEN